MIAVCIAGSYASGKTFVLNYLSELGYKVFSADEVVKLLYKDTKIQQKILTILTPLKEFDTSKIASLIYNNATYRKKLEKFIHPMVLSELEIFLKSNKNEKAVFAEIPLVFETNIEKYFNIIVVCYCSEECRLNRASLNPKFNKEIFKKIEEIQLPQEEKIKRADFTINTEKGSIKLKSDVNNLIRKILK